MARFEMNKLQPDPNCGNCKYWDAKGKEESPSWWLGEEKQRSVFKCKRVKMFWDSTDWDKEGENRIFLDDSKAFVQDGSDYYAELLTKADFFCNMWEAK